jgi:signal peptidase I
MGSTRKPWVAVVLSSVVPGLGQMYNGQLLKGALCLVVVCALALPVAFLVPRSLVWLQLATLAFLLLWLAIIIEAGVTARRIGSAFTPRRYNRWYAYAAVALLFFFGAQPAFASLVSSYAFDVVPITSNALAPVIIKGDYVMVRRTLQPAVDLKEGDVVALALSPDKTWRVIRVGADSIRTDEVRGIVRYVLVSLDEHGRVRLFRVGLPIR